MALTAKEEAFATGLFQGLTQIEAYKQAGYSMKPSEKSIYELACRKANDVKVITRVNELRALAVTPKIMPVAERKERLSEIARGRLTDYNQCGPDGNWIVIDKESPNQGAIKEITSVTRYDKDGSDAAVITNIKLHDAAKAIDLLNKMDGIYTDGTTVNNNTLIINGKPIEECSDDELRQLARGDK